MGLSGSYCKRRVRLDFIAYRTVDLSISLEANCTCENLAGIKIPPNYIVIINLFQGIPFLSRIQLSLAVLPT